MLIKPWNGKEGEDERNDEDVVEREGLLDDEACYIGETGLEASSILVKSASTPREHPLI